MSDWLFSVDESLWGPELVQPSLKKLALGVLFGPLLNLVGVPRWMLSCPMRMLASMFPSVGGCPSLSGYWRRWLLFVSCPVLGSLSIFLMLLEVVGVVEVGLGWRCQFCF